MLSGHLLVHRGFDCDDHPAFLAGLFEVQDEGSQLVALECEAKDGERIIDLCAGAGGKSLALASAARAATILATDSNRVRLSNLAPRAARAGAIIETRLLNPPDELNQLSDWHEKADLVVVDAPCSGSGTWRRNPEGRWRLTADRLDRLTAGQERLLDLGAALVRPGGRLVYAVCSLLSREGAGQIEHFLERHSSWISEDAAIAAGRREGAGRLLTPAHDRTERLLLYAGLPGVGGGVAVVSGGREGSVLLLPPPHDRTDGFFVARMCRPC